MRTTIKIVIGIIITIFLSTIIFIGYLSLAYEDKIKYDFATESKTISIDIHDCKHIIIGNDIDHKTIWQTYHNFHNAFSGTINISSVKDVKDKNKLFLPEELSFFIDKKMADDTLRITLRVMDLFEKYKISDKYIPKLYNANLSFYTDSAISLDNRLNIMNVNLKDINTTFFDLTIRDVYASIENCSIRQMTFRTYAPEGANGRLLSINNSKIDTLISVGSWIDEWNINGMKNNNSYYYRMGFLELSEMKNIFKTIKYVRERSLSQPGDTIKVIFSQ
ncbi:MAG: hypothetical protein LBV43_05760 [Prevotella sp.]|jgi:hypothetical protein|nr:hypothetical protein [Prevotella sp.]